MRYVGCRRPYITHSKQLEAVLKAVDGALLAVEDTVISVRQTESGDGSELQLPELHQSYVSETMSASQTPRR